MIAQARLAREAFFDAKRPGDPQRDRPNLVHLFALGHRVHQLQRRLANHPQPEENDEEADGKAAPMIGRSHGREDYRNSNGDQRDDPRAHVYRVVPGVRRKRHASGTLADAPLRDPEDRLQNHRAGQRP